MEGQKIRQRVFPAPVEVENCTLQMCVCGFSTKIHSPSAMKMRIFPFANYNFRPNFCSAAHFAVLKFGLKSRSNANNL